MKLEKLPDALQRIASEYHSGCPVTLCFDYDGTLTPIVRHPSLARLDHVMRSRLNTLHKLPRVHLAFISGRPLDELKRLVALSRCTYAGSGGLELEIDGSKRVCPKAETIQPVYDELQDDFIDLLTMYPGTWIEQKYGSLAIHFRGLPALAAANFRLDATQRLSGFDELKFRFVTQTIEIAPVGGWDRGTAVRAILDHHNTGSGNQAIPIYCGDAENDREGMAVANSNGGLAIGIGAEVPYVAHSYLNHPDELAHHLEHLIGRLDATAARTQVAPVTAEPTIDAVGAKRGVMLLDRDPAFRATMGRELGQRGWTIWPADSIENARQTMHHHEDSIGAAIVDLQLPGLQGARALNELAKSQPSVFRCATTDNVDEHALAAFRKLNRMPLFAKPVAGSEIDHVLRQHASKS